MPALKLPVILVLVLISFGAVPSYGQQGPLPVDVASPLKRTIVDRDEYTGRFEAVQRVDIRPRVSGFLEEIKFRDGQLVEKGDLLFTIDQRPFIASLDQALAELDAAKAEQHRAAIELKRGIDLLSSNTVAENVVDERRANKLRADAQVAVQEAAVRAAELNVEFTEVRAPFKGRISDRKADVGSLLTQNETVLATIVAIDPIHLVFTGSEADFLKYSRLGASGDRRSSRDAPNPVEARLIDEENWPHKGHMNFVDNELDASAGTIRARAVFPNPDDFLAPGLFARLRIVASGEYEALLLPDEAILSDQAKKIVLVSDAEGTVTAKVVKLGALHEGMRVIRSGITENDKVIVNGVQRARPGGKVAPQEVTLSVDPQNKQ